MLLENFINLFIFFEEEEIHYSSLFTAIDATLKWKRKEPSETHEPRTSQSKNDNSSDSDEKTEKKWIKQSCRRTIFSSSILFFFLHNREWEERARETKNQFKLLFLFYDFRHGRVRNAQKKEVKTENRIEMQW